MTKMGATKRGAARTLAAGTAALVALLGTACGQSAGGASAASEGGSDQSDAPFDAAHRDSGRDARAADARGSGSGESVDARVQATETSAPDAGSGDGSRDGSGEGSGSGSGSEKGSGTGSARGSGSGTGTPTTDSAGCGHGSAGTFTVQIKDGSGADRAVKIIVPSSYNSSKPEYLTTVFGGYGENWQAGTNGTMGYGYTGSTFESRPNPGIVAYPETTTVVADGTTYDNAWDDGYTTAEMKDCTSRDQTLYLNVASYVEENYCVNQGHESVAGFSWGGDFVVALVCCQSDVVHAAAVASATDEFQKTPEVYNEYSRTCKSSPGAFNTPIRFTHDESWADSAYPAPAFMATYQMFLYWNFGSATAAGVTQKSVDAGAKASCTSFSMSGKASVENCGYTGLGHSVPTQAAGFAEDWSTDTVAWLNSL